MKRPWIIMACGFVLGEVLMLITGVLWGSLVVILTAFFSLYILFERGSYKSFIKIKLYNKSTLHSILKKIKHVEDCYIYFFILFICFGFIRTYIQLLPTANEIMLDRQELEGKSGVWTGKVENLDINNDNIVISTGNLLVYFAQEKAGDIKIGNIVSIIGSIERMTQATNPGQFDYAMYYKSKGITHRCFAVSIELVDKKYNYIMQFLYQTRKAGLAVIDSICEEDDAGFLKAAIFGDKNSLSEDMYNLYRKNGIAHLLAISGLHVGILGMGLYSLLRKRGVDFIKSGLISGVLLIAYGALTGGSVSVVRAVAMLIIVYIAEAIGRTYDIISAACIVALATLIVNPHQLYQCGFLLSYVAVLSIGGPGSYIIRILDIKKDWQSAIIISICVQLCTLPIIAYFFYSFPIFGFLINLIVIPLMSYAVVSGILVIITAPISMWLAMTAAGSVDFILKIYNLACEVMSKLAFNTVLTGRPKIWQICIYYILLFISVQLIAHKDKARQRPIKIKDKIWIWNDNLVVSTIICVLLIPVLFKISSGNTETVFIDVGQGDGIYIQEDDMHILVDGGSSSNKNIGKFVLKPFLESKAVDHIDAIYFTHSDMDHINGLIYLLKDYDDLIVDQVYLPSQAEDNTEYEDIVEAASYHGATINYISSGFTMDTKYGEISCLSPAKQDSIEDINEQSLILLYKRGIYKMLLTGDAGITSETKLLEYLKPHQKDINTISDITVLKVGHHGSANSSSEEFLEATHPKIAILSYGENNSYGHPHSETLEKLNLLNCTIFKTGEQGAISITTDGKSIREDTFR